MKESIEKIINQSNELKKEIKKIIVGQENLIDDIVLAIVCQGNVLLEGNPGLGKTQLVKTLGEIMDLNFSRIQFTPDLMPSDIVGTDIVITSKNGETSFEFHKGPIFSNIVLADEINRATPKTQSALLEAMQEKSVTVGKQTYVLKEPFFVLATQNPIDMEGTYTLPEAQLDRFLFKLDVKFPTKEELKEIVKRTTISKSVSLNKFDGESFVQKAKKLSESILISDEVLNYAMNIIVGTHPENNIEEIKNYVVCGSSPRGAQALINTAKVKALLDGRYNVSFDDLRDIAPKVLRHRMILNYEAMHENMDADKLVQIILDKVKE